MTKLWQTLSLIVLLVFISCRRAEDESQKNEVHIPLSAEISTLDPADSYDTISATVIYQSYEPLFEYHYLKRPYTLQPLLADGMPKIENNGRRYTIKIKKNVRYHDDPAFEGKPRFVKAQDFINQIKRLAFVPTQAKGWFLFEGKVVGLDEFRQKAGNSLKKFFELDVPGLSAPDDHTLVIDLLTPYPQLKYALAMSFTVPMPIEAIKYYNNDMRQHIVGTGPYHLKQWDKNLSLVVEKFPHYRKVTYPTTGDRHANENGLLKDAGKQIPFVDKATFHIIKEPQTTWLSFLSNKISFLVIPKDNYNSAITPTGDLSPELAEKDISLQVSPTLTFWWLAFNMNDSIVGKNKKLRQAIGHAVNFDRFIALFTNNIAQKANSIYPPGIPGYDPAHRLPYEYNLVKAKELLREAGYPDGKGLPTLTFDVRGSSTYSRQQADFIRSELGKIGINVNIVINTFPAFLTKATQGKLQFWQGGWSMDYPDAENIVQLLITKNHPPGPNSTYYSNPAVDKLYNELKVTTDENKKAKLMKQIENIVNKDLPWVMQYYSRTYLLVHNHVKNYRSSDLIYNFLKYLKVTKK